MSKIKVFCFGFGQVAECFVNKLIKEKKDLDLAVTSRDETNQIEYNNLIKETQTEEENKIKIQNDFNIAKDMTDLKTLTFGERIKFATDILTSELKILENYFQRYEILIDIMKLKGGFTKMFNLNTIRFKGNI